MADNSNDPKAQASNPEQYGAEPVHGNYTAPAEMHLWCSQALASLVANPEVSLAELNDDIQAAVRYLLGCEIERAWQAQKAGA